MIRERFSRSMASIKNKKRIQKMQRYEIEFGFAGSKSKARKVIFAENDMDAMFQAKEMADERGSLFEEIVRL